MNGYTAWCLYIVAVFALIGVALYFTGSLWSFLGLLAVTSYTGSKEDD